MNTMIKTALKNYIETLELKNYSVNTINNYRNHFIPYLNYFSEKKPSQINKEEIINYLMHLRSSRQLSASEQNQIINAVKFFYEKVLNRPKELYDIPRAKKPFQLPGIFSAEEVRQIIDAANNLKHKSILSLAYAGGLRISEIVNLKISEIDSQRMVINIRQAKGRKDRIVMLSEKLLLMLRDYYKIYKPKEYLFEGQSGGMYSLRSIQEILKKAKSRAGIKKKGSVHSLRHSFATHLLEGGTDILSIKKLLGHQSLRTTMIYTHVSNEHISKIQSPLDKIL
ncbi:MAG TPA: site-specific integrase [Ignavibacteria bacterium]|nr:site-specific integrase [Ignavibacteria bacterium]HRJ99879.1 site-specific integrase [Ignavibacteria bacterium]